MNLPDDVSRCDGKTWPGFGVQPECIDCARRLALLSAHTGQRVVYMTPPQETPCALRIAPVAQWGVA